MPRKMFLHQAFESPALEKLRIEANKKLANMTPAEIDSMYACQRISATLTGLLYPEEDEDDPSVRSYRIEEAKKILEAVEKSGSLGDGSPLAMCIHSLVPQDRERIAEPYRKRIASIEAEQK